MAETMLHHGPAARDGGDKYQVVVLVGADVLAGVADHAQEGRCQVEDGPSLGADTALRLACEAWGNGDAAALVQAFKAR